MTVRAWFRLQRVALWERGDLFSHGIERVAAAVVDGTSLPPKIRVGDYWLIIGASQLVTEEILAQIEAELRREWYITKADLTR